MNLLAAMIGLVLFLIAIGVFFWAINACINAISPWIMEPFTTFIRVILVLVAVIIAIFVIIWILNLVGLHVTMPHLG